MKRMTSSQTNDMAGHKTKYDRGGEGVIEIELVLTVFIQLSTGSK